MFFDQNSANQKTKITKTAKLTTSHMQTLEKCAKCCKYKDKDEDKDKDKCCKDKDNDCKTNYLSYAGT